MNLAKALNILYSKNYRFNHKNGLIFDTKKIFLYIPLYSIGLILNLN